MPPIPSKIGINPSVTFRPPQVVLMKKPELDAEAFEMLGMVHCALETLEDCPEFARIIPEVRSNLVYCRRSPTTPLDVLAIDGRITSVDHLPKGAGRPRFGASSHMARLIIELHRIDPSIRAGINFSAESDIVRWMERYARRKRWVFGVIDRAKEPAEVQEAEGASMPWKIAEVVRACGGRAPKLFYETGAVGKEPVAVLVGADPVTVVGEACELARKYIGGM